MDNRRVLKNRMSALKDCEPWEMWSWGDFIESLGIDRSSNWEDTVDRVCRLIGGDPEREKAADWVDANGGLDSVQERMGLFARMLNRIDSIVCGDEQHCFDERIDLGEADELFGVICDALGKRLMPLGMEWPPKDCEGEDLHIGEKAHFLRTGYDGDHEWDDVIVAFRHQGVEGEGDAWIVVGEEGEAFACDCAVGRPAVLAADGLPIEVGQTVYTAFSGSPLVVEKIEGAYLLDAGGTMLRADCATHTPPDTQERIDEDATMPPRAYYAERIGHDVGLKDDAECTEAMVRHLLNRQRELDAKTGDRQ